MNDNQANVEELLASEAAAASVSPALLKLDGYRIATDTEVPEENFLFRMFGTLCSQHMVGEAADLSVPNEQVAREWFQWIAHHTDFDQMLFEHSSRMRNRWLHLSCRWDRRRNRHQAIFNYWVP